MKTSLVIATFAVFGSVAAAGQADAASSVNATFAATPSPQVNPTALSPPAADMATEDGRSRPAQLCPPDLQNRNGQDVRFGRRGNCGPGG